MENKLIMPQCQSSLGFFGVIRESTKTTGKNGKLLVPILLFVFLSYSLLDFTQEYILAPMAKDFGLQLAQHPNLFHDFTCSFDQSTYARAFNAIREIIIVNLVIMVISSIISLFFLIATVSSSSEAYTAKLLGPKDIFLKIKRSWKRPIVTSFYMFLLTLGMVLFYVISIGITSILVVNSWALLFSWAITILFPLCYLYMATLWMVSLIVSVLEEGFGGFKAIGRAVELMKGRRLQALLMMVLFTIAYTFIFLMSKFVASYNRSLSAERAITISFTNGFYCLWELFMYVVYTVSYHEWKKSHDEREGKGLYLPIAVGEA